MRTIDVVCAIIFWKGKVLIARKKISKSLGGFWEFPGGKVEPKEDFIGALTRELQEELGIKVREINEFAENEHEYPSIKVRLIAFKCKYVKSTIKLTDHDRIEWVEINELKSFKLAPADIPIVDKLVLSNL